MIFLDFKPGVTFSLLLKAMAETAGEESAELRARRPNADGPLASLWSKAWAESSIDGLIRVLQSGCRTLPPVTLKTAETPEGVNRDELTALFALAGAASIDPFEFSAYISISMLAGRDAPERRLLVPVVGADSPEAVFSILQNTAVVINPQAEIISPFLAASIRTRFSPFARRAEGGRFLKALTWTDPLAPGSLARAFFYDEAGSETDEDVVAVIEANLDDMTPEILARAVQVLMENGALDCAVDEIGMKKGRIGFKLEVMARPEDRTKMEELLLLHTSTFGVRTTLAERRVLKRKTEYFESSYGRLRVKRGYFHGKCVRAVPEYEDVAAISEQSGVPLIRLYADVAAEIARESTYRQGPSAKE
ncbi:MAG: DUF111 family protein [Spirochaetales bacterium]|nr:DUF111 family protein [Spirochaetales bacterium]